MNTKATSVLFIDSSVKNYELLLKGVAPEIEVVVLDSKQNGVEQITQVLLQCRGIENVHIVSHGSPGTLYLGNTQLSLGTLEHYTEQLKAWFSQSSNSPQLPNLFLYGCNVGASNDGQNFLKRLHSLTGANIAASNDLTGSSILGGDWELEVKVGEINTSVALSSTASEIGLLNTNIINGTSANDTLTGSAAADEINGYEGNDSLYGRGGNDILNGGSGADTIFGGAGDDTIDGGDGIDMLNETADVNFTLTNTQLIGLGSDTLRNIEQARLAGGNGDNTLDASEFTLGSVSLFGGAGNDTLKGGASHDNLSGGTDNDIIQGGAGNDNLSGNGGDDTIDGGDGIDVLRETADVNFTLTNTQLVGLGSDTFINIEQAILAGGNGNNTLDASAFTLGRVWLYGGAGNDTLIGSAKKDILSGGAGNDYLSGGAGDDNFDGGDGIDTLSETADVNFILKNTQLTGIGPDTLSNIEQVVLNGGNSNNTIDASAFTLGRVWLSGGGGNDVIKGSAGDDTLDGGDGIDTVSETADVNFTLTNTQLIGISADTLSNIEQVTLVGGNSDNIINASTFTLGNVSLSGGAGNDTVSGGAGNDTVSGGAGNDTVSGGMGNDTIDGGDGIDLLSETANVNFILTNSQLTGTGNDTLSSIEQAKLAGGNGDNTIDASAFTLGTVSLFGGAGNDVIKGGTSHDSISGGSGNDTINGNAGHDNISGDGGDNVIDGGYGIDTLRETADVNFTLTNTELIGLGKDIFTNIEQVMLSGGNGDNTLDASTFSLGTVWLYGVAGNDTLKGSIKNDNLSGGTGNDIIDGGKGFDTLSESGDVNFTLTNTQLTGLGSDVLNSIEQVRLTGGISNNTIDASAFTLGSVSLFGDAGNDILKGSLGNDTLSGGAGNDIIEGGNGTDTVSDAADTNFSLTNTQLIGAGIDTLNSIEQASLTGGVSDNILDASAFTLGGVFLFGAAGNDTLKGTSSNDTLSGGAGNDIIEGGIGTDTVSDAADVNFTLTNSQLIGAGIDTLVSIEQASLTGGISNNTLDASAFTLGSVTLSGGEGNDTLIACASNDTLSGGGGDDNINGGSGTDTLSESGDLDFTLTNTQLTGLGNDTFSNIEQAKLTGGISNNTINASAFSLGNVSLFGGEGNDILIGGTLNDTLSGGEGNDTIDGGTGNDTLSESADVNFTLTNTQLVGLGNDTFSNIEQVTLTGGTDNNVLDASAFTLTSVTLSGGAGNDILNGGAGNDILNGGAGNDVLNGGAGNDTFNSSAGNDTIDGDSGKDLLNESANVNFTLTNTQLVGLGNHSISNIEQVKLTGGIGDNTINASAFTLGDVTLVGGDGKDILTGGASHDFLYGQNGNDTLKGDAGNDTLSGGVGDDLLNGGAGFDKLYGDAGADTFVLVSGNGTDNIYSFEDSVDKLGLSGALTYGALTITYSGGNTSIRVTSTNEVLATLISINSSLINENDFTSVSG
ncbi:hypothetical protein WA1_45295 [Scytonema hofmannii PCC 7110]|uniref:DUF4347 domain-containing protein n=1 Tax=Scytonema hofmannii PCC 7110 TaxID=128403 RepID=A0A139WWR3_9CYAN|nr:DUF4347 domain-containing protein [Scytonema hofmannii]KYC36879.1 hypothetical protein WA1_45295 [Scytonema hofmannii PCC 7110]